MATYINYYGGDEEDARVQGAEWLQKVISQLEGSEEEGKFCEKFKQLHNEDTTDDTGLCNLFIDYSQTLFGAIAEGKTEERVKEVESFFALIFYLLTQLEEQSHLDAVTKRLCDVFSADEKSHPELRLRLLMMLYNTFPSAEQRPGIFRYILDYSAKAGLFDQVSPYLEYLDSWIVDWAAYLTTEDKRSLFCDISEYLRQLKKNMESFQYLKKYHLLFQGEDKKVLSSDKVKNMTIQLMKDAIQLPFVIQFDDLVTFDTVKDLESDSKNADLVKLCRIYLSGTVNDLRDFYGKHKKLFEEHDLKWEDAMSKIRLLTLSTLAQGRSEMSLSEVAQALEEKEDNVEPWVVRAISEGVIDGRIDQLNCKVLVKSAFQRKFEKDEWMFLDSKLTSWIDNIENIIKFIGQQKATREGVLSTAMA